MHLPSSDVMWADIDQKRVEMQKRYVGSSRHTIQVDYIPVMDEIGEMVGCKPDLGQCTV